MGGTESKPSSKSKSSPKPKPSPKPKSKANPPPAPAVRKSKKGKPESPGIFARLFDYFTNFSKKDPPKTPVKGIRARLENILKNNFRGVIGVMIPLFVLSWQGKKFEHDLTVELMWMWMLWFFLWQPVSIPVTGLIPVFLLPMSATMSTVHTCQCYMNENILLYIMCAMILLLLNNSGVDRRIALWFMCSGDSCQFSGKRLIFKVSSAAFFLSMFSSRLIITSTLTQYMTPPLMQLQTASAKGAIPEPNFDEMRYIINNAIQTASGIGSTAILHSSYATVLFRTIWAESPARTKEYPDIFNYLQYSAFAFPVAFVMFVLNFCYHMILLNWVTKKPMSPASMSEMQRLLLRFKAELPKQVSLHEKLSVIFTIFYLLMFLFRWAHWIDGWAEFSRDPTSTEIPRVKDATTAAIFLIFLHVLPKSYGFLKYITAEKKSQLPPAKAESSVLWWRYVDKNVNYGYFFVFGAATALMNSARETGLTVNIGQHFGRGFTDPPWNVSLFLVCFMAALFANCMTAVAACTIFLPFVLCMSTDAQIPWPTKSYIGALGVGIGSSLGFCFPFQYTPAYFCYHTGKVPKLKMLKYSFLSVWICFITLWVGLLVWAPFLFDPEDYGIIPVDAPGTNSTG